MLKFGLNDSLFQLNMSKSNKESFQIKISMVVM